MWDQRPSFRFEIDNFSEKESAVSSKAFVSGGCEWYLCLHPKGDGVCDDHMSLYLIVANDKSLRTGWKRRAKYYFCMLNQSDKELYRSSIGQGSNVFCAENPSWGFRQTMSLSKLGEIGVLEKDRLIIEVYLNIIEVFDGEGEGGDVPKQEDSIGNDNDIQVFNSHVASLLKIIMEYPELVNDFKPMDEEVQTDFMNGFQNFINTVQKHPDSLSDTELDKAFNEMKEMIYLQLEWMKSNLEELSLEGKKPSCPDGSVIQEGVKNLEMMQSSSKMDCLKSEMAKKAKADVQKLEEYFRNFWWREPQLDDQFLSHEERIKNLEQMVSNLKVESEKEESQSFDGGFFLVNKV